jgi:membrane peptidoglycan carboxypeptidase
MPPPRTLVAVRVGDGLLKMLGLCLLAGVLMAGMLFPVVGALGVVSNRASDTIDSVSADLVATDPPLITTITDSKGKPIAYLYDQFRVPVTPDQIAPTMKAALISVEDRRFYEHHGVDWKGTVRALISNQTGEDVQGASTLTQQYVKNYLINVVYRDQIGTDDADPGKKIERGRAQEQTVTRKLREARLAIQLEQSMSKEEILTGYLNVVEFTDRVFGVGAAARAYFKTTPDKLTVAQSALLAGMVNNPSLYNPWRRPKETLERRNFVIDKMVETKSLSPENAAAAKKEPLGIQPSPKKPAANCVGAGPQYGFFCQYVEDYLMKIGFTEDQLYTGGYTIKTTFDAAATRIAKRAAEAQVPKHTPGINDSMAIIRPGKKRHEVTVLVSNRDYGLNVRADQTQIAYPYGVQNKFGAGSIFKIFTSAAFLEKGGGINTTIKTPHEYTSHLFKGGADSCPSTGEPNTHWYCLSNFGESSGYPAQMPLQNALATSPNTGFVILEESVGMNKVVDMASRLGLRETMGTNMVGQKPNPKSDDPNFNQSQSQFFRGRNGSPGNASFTLSPAPLSTLELANVGATLMSGGVWCPPTPLVEVLDRNGKKVNYSEQPCEQAVDDGLANTLVTGMSKDVISGTAAGAARSFNWTRPMLGKTGTTQQSKSAAFVGATPQLAGAVQVFNDGRSPEGICDSTPGEPYLCGENGNIFGGKAPARTWFDAMTQIHNNSQVRQLPPTDPRYVNGGPQSQVPDVVGYSEQEARDRLQRAGYRVAVEEINSSSAKGTVVSQSPRGSALANELITIRVSTGYVPPPQTSDPPASSTKPPPSGGGGGGGRGPGTGPGPGGGGGGEPGPG